MVREIFTINPEKNVKYVANKYIIADRWCAINVLKSSIPNQDRRKAIRKTWASVKYAKDVRLETIFVVGVADTEEMQRFIEKENRTFGDILQIDLPDDKE